MEALQDFNRAIEIDPTASKYLVRRSNALHRLVRKDEAIRDLERALEIDPSNEGAHAGLALLLSAGKARNPSRRRTSR